MKNLQKLLLATSLTIACSGFAVAGTPGVDKREKNQKHRIVQGVKSGELTARETAKLVKGQKQLKHMERRAKADGVVTKKERIRLHHKANKESAKIKHNKHDKQKRPKAQ
jgi:hypothetical protein